MVHHCALQTDQGIMQKGCWADLTAELEWQTKVCFQMSKHFECASASMLLSSCQDLCRKYLWLRFVKPLKWHEAWFRPHKKMLEGLLLWFLCFVRGLVGMIWKVWFPNSKIVFHLESERRL